MIGSQSHLITISHLTRVLVGRNIAVSMEHIVTSQIGPLHILIFVNSQILWLHYFCELTNLLTSSMLWRHKTRLNTLLLRNVSCWCPIHCYVHGQTSLWGQCKEALWICHCKTTIGRGSSPYFADFLNPGSLFCLLRDGSSRWLKIV